MTCFFFFYNQTMMVMVTWLFSTECSATGGNKNRICVSISDWFATYFPQPSHLQHQARHLFNILNRNVSVLILRFNLITNASATNYTVTATKCKNNSASPWFMLSNYTTQDFPEYSYTCVEIGTNVMFSLRDDCLDPVGSPDSQSWRQIIVAVHFNLV